MLPDTLRTRLRSLADDCEERARLAPTGSRARALFHEAARDARQASTLRHTCASELQAALNAMEALAHAARWYIGEIDSAERKIGELMQAQRDSGHLKHGGARVHSGPLEKPITLTEAGIDKHLADRAIPDGTLNARQLAGLFGMTERGARKAIVRGVDRCLPGFYREGCHWYAERKAFEQMRPARFRIGAELPGDGTSAM